MIKKTKGSLKRSMFQTVFWQDCSREKKGTLNSTRNEKDLTTDAV